jgi:hypothetical protein
MSDNMTTDDAFWDIVDGALALANDSCENIDPSKVSAALLYAAARFNAFIVASNSLDRKEFRAEKDEAVQYLTKQYRSMLGENLADYEDNFKEYTRGSDAGEGLIED